MAAYESTRYYLYVEMNPSLWPEVLKLPEEILEWAIGCKGHDPAGLMRVYQMGLSDRAMQLLTSKHRLLPEHLDLMSHDPREDVRASVARRPDTWLATVTRLATDPDEWVRDGAIANLRKRQGADHT